VQLIVDDSQQQHHASKFVEDKTGITIIALSLQSLHLSLSSSWIICTIFLSLV
jgi:hypothetical protein